MNQTHRYPYAIHQRTCAWWGHCYALLRIIWASWRHLHQGVFWEYFQQFQITAGDSWSCGEYWLNIIFFPVMFMSMFKGGFSFCGFSSFLVLYGQAVCKGWLSLVARPYIFDIFMILYIKSGLRGVIGIIKTHPNT